ncbi:MAG: SRPBCC family protein [Thermoleophilia bacterium]
MSQPSVLQRSVDVPAPADVVFRFHLDTRNAPLISPPGARFLEVSGDFPVQPGCIVRLRVRQPPIPVAQTWLVRIAEVQQDRLVTDVAQRSPFAAWRHEHRFEALDAHTTRMTDHVEYRLPLGPLGRLADRLFVRAMLNRMFTERHRLTVAHFSGGSA